MLGYQAGENASFRNEHGRRRAPQISFLFQQFNRRFDHRWRNDEISATTGNATSWQDSACLLA
jgi:hypothetical protein